MTNTWHTVADSEDLLLIAKTYGFRSWESIYEHEKNQDFRKNNPNPYVLHRGDRLWIPEKTPKSVDIETGKEYRFVAKSLKHSLSIYLEDDDGDPYVDKKYEIWIAGNKYGQEERRTGVDGHIRAEIPVVQTVELKVWLIDDVSNPETYTVQIGNLDPIDTILGIQDRLSNLGYEVDDPKGTVGPKTTIALKTFQAEVGLSPTGRVNEATRKKLIQLHDKK